MLGFAVRDAATGGAGDANTTAGLGVPTLDGLGPIGGNDHAPGEYLEVDSIVPRTTLFAGLLVAAGRDPEIATWAATRRAASELGERRPGACADVIRTGIAQGYLGRTDGDEPTVPCPARR